MVFDDPSSETREDGLAGAMSAGPFLSQGFDGVKFLCDAVNYRLRKAIGIAGMAEIKAQCDFEDADPEGNA